MDDNSYFDAIARIVAEEAATLEPQMRTALLDALRVVGVTVTLEDLLNEIPAITGAAITVPEKWTRKRLWIHTAIKLYEELPNSWQHDSVAHSGLIRLGDCIGVYNTTLQVMDACAHAISTRLQAQLTSPAHRWATRYIEQLIERVKTGEKTGEILLTGDQLDGPPVLSVLSGSGSNSEPTPRKRVDTPAALWALLELGLPLVDDDQAATLRLDVSDDGQAESALSVLSEPEPLPPLPVHVDALATMPGDWSALTDFEDDESTVTLADAAAVDQGADDDQADVLARDFGLEAAHRHPSTGLPSLAHGHGIEVVEVDELPDDLPDVDAGAGDAGADDAKLAICHGRVRRLQWAVGAMCTAAVVIIVAAGLMTHSAQERVRETIERADMRIELAETKAAQSAERLRAVIEAPVAVDVEWDQHRQRWTVSDNGQFRVDGYTFTLSKIVPGGSEQ